MEFLGKKVKREFTQWLNDMGTQMLIQRIKGKCHMDIRATVKALEDEIEDERYEKMGEFFREERDAILREAAQRN